MEGEPELVDNYVDFYNGGCNTPPDYPFQHLCGDQNGELVLCCNAGNSARRVAMAVSFSGIVCSLRITSMGPQNRSAGLQIPNLRPRVHWVHGGADVTISTDSRWRRPNL